MQRASPPENGLEEDYVKLLVASASMAMLPPPPKAATIAICCIIDTYVSVMWFRQYVCRPDFTQGYGSLSTVRKSKDRSGDGSHTVRGDAAIMLPAVRKVGYALLLSKLFKR